MTVHQSCRPASATIVPSPLDVLRHAFARLMEGHARRARRREIERMLGFDDQLLADIGVTRDDVHHALTTAEPSADLACAARYRRRRF